MCVCVCVCVWRGGGGASKRGSKEKIGPYISLWSLGLLSERVVSDLLPGLTTCAMKYLWGFTVDGVDGAILL